MFGPSMVYEDNSATILHLLNDKLMPQVKHMDVKVTWIRQQKNLEIFITEPCPTD